MSERWYREKKKEYYYRKAKREGFISRASYKLMQIDRKFHIFQNSDIVIDLGSSPGGWSQVAAKRSGGVIGVDLKGMKQLDNVRFVRGDMRERETFERVKKALEYYNAEKASVIISDMAPNISGNYSYDHSRSVTLFLMALEFADIALENGGKFVGKVFQGELIYQVKREMKKRFAFVKFYSPKASRSSSSEIYCIGKGFAKKVLQSSEE